MRAIPETTTKVELAKSAGISRTTLYKWLKGYQVTKVVEAAIQAAIKQAA